jgi:hypothetical protein
VMRVLERVKQHKESIIEQLRSYQIGIQSASSWQYDALAELATASHKQRN